MTYITPSVEPESLKDRNMVLFLMWSYQFTFKRILKAWGIKVAH